MKTVIKRICAMLLCIAMSMSFAVHASENTRAMADDSLKYDPRAGIATFTGYTPDYEKMYPSYTYDLFKEISKLYLDTHLYEFSEEQLTEAFIMKLMRENPGLAKMFINTLLGTMDRYSAYYEVGKGINTDGSSNGYGISIGDETSYIARKLGRKEPGIYVTRVLDGSQALAAGIKEGDRIVSVEGIKTDGLTPDAALYMVKRLPYVAEEEFDENGVSLGIPNEPEYVTDELTGEKKYLLHMTLERDGQTYDVAITKGKMFPSSINYDVPKGKDYAYIQITDFQGSAVVADFKAALENAKKDKQRNLIIDLRDNGGGVLSYAVDMANLLISEEGRLLYYTNSRELENPEPVYSAGGGMTFEKITVLCNENTASAAELFAMMLKFNCSAILVGKTTYGKAVGQETYSFTNGDMFSITSFEILTPTKDSYNEVGLVPDVEIKQCLTKLEFPEALESFNYINYKEMAPGTESDTVLGFERRMVLFGFLRPEYADGVFDEVTTSLINALRLYSGKEPNGMLDDENVAYITLVINKYKNYYYTYDSQLECAEMTFLSRSQGKRRAKELERESEKVEAERQAYLDEVEAQIKAEDEAAKAEQAANGSAENTENTESSESTENGNTENNSANEQ